MVRLIWAQGRNRVIGLDGGIPWHLPEDMAHFRQLTMGGVCVMGRRTWESLPDAFRPLPGRENIVLTSRAVPLEGARSFGSVADVLSSYQDFWVIGGAAVYSAFLPHAAEIHLTELDIDVSGDTFAPELPGEWACAAMESHTSASGIGYAFQRWERAVASPA